jgi:hypothetical protein
MTDIADAATHSESMGKERGMMRERTEWERRRTVRVGARGRVAVHGDRCARGEILDLSSTGVRFRLAGPFAGCVGDRLVLDLRFDGARGGWWNLTGRIVRVGLDDQLAVAFESTPTDFEDWIQGELVASLEAEREVYVLLVDPVASRRRELADALRSTGHRVSEAATPLDAIYQLGESHYHPRLVAIADTIPSGIADDLRAYLRAEHPDSSLLRTKTGARHAVRPLPDDPGSA